MRTPGAEIDDPVLVVAEHAMQAATDQDGHVRKGAERPVSDEYVTRLEFVVREGRLGDFMRPQWRGQKLQEQTRAGVEQSQDAGNWEATSRSLIGRLPERSLQHGSIGH
jgi:hypothetical protein